MQISLKDFYFQYLGQQKVILTSWTHKQVSQLDILLSGTELNTSKDLVMYVRKRP